MAQVQTEHSPAYWVDKSRDGASPGDTNYEDAKWNSISNLRTALAAADAAYYTTERLNQMTKNDMVYALRVIDGLTDGEADENKAGSQPVGARSLSEPPPEEE